MHAYVLDSHDHLIVKHDLFSHEGINGDGIAEAFQEFAKREGLSFALGKRYAPSTKPNTRLC